MLVKRGLALKASLARDRSEDSIDILQKKARLPRHVVDNILAGNLSTNSQERLKRVMQPKRRTAGPIPWRVSN
jgi:hypothetical protein